MEEASNFFMKACFAQMESATNVSKIIFEHSDESEMTSDHVVAGLVYRLMTPMTDSEVMSSMKVIDDIIDQSSSEEEDEDEEVINDLEVAEVNEIRKIIKPYCNCNVCMKARICMNEYSEYRTQDPLGRVFKNAIETTCSEHNLFI